MDKIQNPFEILLNELMLIRQEIAEIKDRMDKASPHQSRRGGVDLVMELTGLSASYIKHLASTNELPTISGKAENRRW